MTDPLAYRAPLGAEYYRAPSAFHPARMILGLLAGLIAAVAGGVAYAKIEPGVESLKLRVGSAVVAAAAVGLIAMAASAYGKVRSPVVASVVGAAVAAVAVYAMWVVFARDELLRMMGLDVGY